jgi:hypothetical protein
MDAELLGLEKATESGGMERVSQTLPPMMVRSPITVSPPTMVELA